LNGGWQSRIILALKSNLPNEVDWAFNKLVKISHLHLIHIQQIPGISTSIDFIGIFQFTQTFIGISQFKKDFIGLQELLIQHMSPVFDSLILSTDPNDFETTSAVFSLREISLFHSKDVSCALERTLQVLHIIRNFLFFDQNPPVFARDHVFLTNLAKGLALPNASYFIEIKQYCFEIYEFIVPVSELRGTSDFYLACMRKAIQEPDRALVLSSIRSLTKMALIEANEKHISELGQAVLSKMFMYLLVPDEELVVVVLEFLYIFTNLSKTCSKVVQFAPFNIVKLLLKYVVFKGKPIPDMENPPFFAAFWYFFKYVIM
jgi:hypothetical protein